MDNVPTTSVSSRIINTTRMFSTKVFCFVLFCFVFGGGKILNIFEQPCFRNAVLISRAFP